jgi:ubiquitin carboxyl-terminal hydrolase 5/13
MEDADFNNPLDTDSVNQNVHADLSAVTSSFNPNDIEMLTSLGFTETQAKKALKATESNVERAAEWLFSHADDPGFFDEESTSGDVGAGVGVGAGGDSSTLPLPHLEPPQDSDGQADGTYEMIGIISHIGKNTDCGHYVCHIKKDNDWYFFNDDKVTFIIIIIIIIIGIIISWFDYLVWMHYLHFLFLL